MKRTGRANVDLAILSYDERLRSSARSATVRRARATQAQTQHPGDVPSRERRFLIARKAIGGHA